MYDLVSKIEKTGIHKFFLAIKINQLQQQFTVIPIFSSLDIYATEKARLKKSGNILDDFDLLIGATAISNDLTLITKNVSDFERLTSIQIEDWTA
jgi:tRNA(fMet)-specific endonuclease VapC